jgi:hypothetical protein
MPKNPIADAARKAAIPPGFFMSAPSVKKAVLF